MGCAGLLAPLAWRHPEATSKEIAEVRLVGKTTIDGDFAERLNRILQEIFRHIKSLRDYVLVRRNAERRFERSCEITGAKTYKIREVFDSDDIREVFLNVLCHSATLPSRKDPTIPRLRERTALNFLAIRSNREWERMNLVRDTVVELRIQDIIPQLMNTKLILLRNCCHFD